MKSLRVPVKHINMIGLKLLKTLSSLITARRDECGKLTGGILFDAVAGLQLTCRQL